MNEELIKEIVSRILSEPSFQALLQGNTTGTLENKVIKPAGIVLLNYVSDLEQVLRAVKLSYGADYTLSVLPSDQVFVAKPTLPEGMSWITPQDALRKTTWQQIIIPTCSANTLAKAALGIRDNPINEIIGRGISQGIPTLLVIEYLGFTAQTPKAYKELYEGYLLTVQSFGVSVSATLSEECTINRKTNPPIRTSLNEQRSANNRQKNISDEQSELARNEIRFDKKFLGDKQVYGIPEGSIVLVKRGTVVSPLARDTLKSRKIELRQEMEEGRQ